MSLDTHSHLQGISAFVSAVETGSFTAAAIRLGVSKSAVGKSVARLEEKLGARLLDRTTRSLNLTVEGQGFFESCRKVLEELDRAEALLSSRRQKPSGVLRINLPISFGRRCVMPILRGLARRQPELALDVSFTDRRIDLVEEGADLVVRLGDPGDQASLVGRRLGAQRSILCASPAYLQAHGRPRSVEDLEKHDCIGFARDGRPLPWTVIDRNGDRIAVKIRPRHTISHGDALREAAIDGMGLAYLATWLAADDVRSGSLEAVLMPEPLEDQPIHVLWPQSRHLSVKVRVVVDALVDALTPIPPWDRGL